MLEMEMDSTDDVVARIYRRMASTPVSSPAHSAYLPHPRSAPPAARRSAPATPKLSNPLAQSASATTIAVPLTASPSGRPTPKQRTTSASSRVRSRSISSDSGECLSSGNWSPPSSLPQHRPEHLQEQQQQRQHRGARTPDGLLAPSSGIGYDCSDIEDFSSSKSSSMSCSSEGSELSGLGLGKGHDEDADERAEAEAEVAPAMLDLMTTRAAARA
ncbi:hypothetical protein ONE63_004806 [Megalurothrips usitatus]|uniref:Uncharacterized protein n=1 Tax=Megalurothrips usitatus TaxID=439358 RepID=A0AAV7X6B3_9NEOP|nr:hypothetical protein ONE63_004806 [Megalurothrips usitatus]